MWFVELMIPNGVYEKCTWNILDLGTNKSTIRDETFSVNTLLKNLKWPAELKQAEHKLQSKGNRAKR